MEEQGEVYIDLRELLKIFWLKKYLVVFVVMLMTGLGVWYALVQTDIYESKTTFMVASSDEKTLNLGGAAALFGAASSNSTIAKYKPLLQSEDLIIAFIENNNLTQFFFPEYVDSLSGNWLTTLDSTEIPIPLDAVNLLRDNHLELDFEIGENLFQIKMRHYSPELAFKWLNNFTETFLNRVESVERKKSDQNIEFYQRKMRLTNNVEHKSALISLVAEETKKALLLGRNKFQVIDRAKIPRKKVAPNKKVIVALAMILGIIFSVLLVLGQYFYQQFKQASEDNHS